MTMHFILEFSVMIMSVCKKYRRLPCPVVPELASRQTVSDSREFDSPLSVRTDLPSVFDLIRPVISSHLPCSPPIFDHIRLASFAEFTDSLSACSSEMTALVQKVIRVVSETICLVDVNRTDDA